MRGDRSLADGELDLFGPGTDLILSLLAILLVVLFAVSREAGRREEECRNQLKAAKQKEQLEIAEVRANQDKLIQSLAETFQTKPRQLGTNSFRLPIEDGEKSDLIIDNDATLQRIRFGTHILFETDDHILKPRGRTILGVFGATLKAHLSAVTEVQIQGHADLRRSRRYESNLHLAAQRAIEVYTFLAGTGIDPARHLMTATSFGEFKPVARGDRDPYSEELLRRHNSTIESQNLNRRIEIVLIYRRGTGPKAADLR